MPRMRRGSSSAWARCARVLGSEAEYENHQAGGHGIGALLPGTRAAESLNMPSRSLTKTFFFWIGIGFISSFF